MTRHVENGRWAHSSAVPDRSPYDALPPDQWLAKTHELLNAYPVSAEELVEVVLSEWTSIFESRIGKPGLRIGHEVFPIPQIMGNFLHELIPYDLQQRYPDVWRRDHSGADKDLVNLKDDRFSTEIKTSSDRTGIFGNRSYAQPATGIATKSKSGYFLTVNFQKWKGGRGGPAARGHHHPTRVARSHRLDRPTSCYRPAGADRAYGVRDETSRALPQELADFRRQDLTRRKAEPFGCDFDVPRLDLEPNDRST